MTNAEARFSKSLCPRKPEGSLRRTAQDVHLDSHTAPGKVQEVTIAINGVHYVRGRSKSDPATYHSLIRTHTPVRKAHKESSVVECCFTSTETVGLLETTISTFTQSSRKVQ